MKAERNAALAASKAAERELEQLRTASLSETEKAIAAARKAGANEVTERLHARVRRAETKLALARAGRRRRPIGAGHPGAVSLERIVEPRHLVGVVMSSAAGRG